jgi:thiol-disulfide isomerase/thioredoxin
MGRLSALNPVLALTLALTPALSACEESHPPAVTRERSQAIAPAAPPAGVTNAPAAAPVGGAPAPKKARRALCQGQMSEGKPLPKQRVSRRDGASDLPARAISGAPGQWTWVNFWAAWCAPCKEEIPRLKAWEREVSQNKLRVAFVSLDDDPRQLQQFLAGSNELTQTFWLREGKERDDWMSAAGLGTDPELPFHLLVDPENKVRCRVQGAIEDSDLPDLVRLLGGA